MTHSQKDADLKSALERCESAVLHRPETIQPHACILSLENTNLHIVSASANIEEFTEISPDSYLGRKIDSVFNTETRHKIANGIQDENAIKKVLELGPVSIGKDRLHLSTCSSGNHTILEMTEYPNTESTAQTILDEVSVVSHVIHSADSQEDLFSSCCQILRMISNYDHVMLIHQDADCNSQVIAENKVAHATSYLGLHFPEWDIPKPAREIMTLTPFRIISDSYSDQVPVMSISDTPLDMTHLTCRGVSPIHLTYMQNMQTAASFTINITIDGKLWGFFSFHNRKPKFPGPTLREIARLFRHMFSTKLSALQKRDHLRNSQSSHGFLRKVEQVANETPLKSIFTSDTLSNLQKIVDAQGVAVCEGKQIFLYGDTPDSAAIQRDIPKLAKLGPVFQTHSISKISKDFDPGISHDFPGVLSILISEQFTIVFFRKARNKTVAWAGNPEKPLSYVDGKPVLNPRNSFEIYKTMVKGTSTPWTDHQVEMAREIALVLTSAERKDSTNRVKRHQTILINELNHRVRNILSVIRSLSKQSISTSTTIDEYVDIFDKRIEAVAAAHEVGSKNFSSDSSLKRILHAETSPYNENCERVTIKGVDASLNRNFAPLFALTIHEITTNAAKYGALSVPNGTVHVSCKVTSHGIRLRWKERGGPETTTPTEKGFGTTLIEKSIPYETDGTVNIQYRREGVEIEINIPDSELGSILAPEDNQVLSPLSAYKPSFTGGTCLVVEDSLIIAMDTTQKLENAGFDAVKLASTDKEAIETISQNKINFAILDVNLGDAKDSNRIATILRSKNIPFVFLTGYDSPPIRRQFNMGEPILRKPLQQEQLSKILSDYSIN